MKGAIPLWAYLYLLVLVVPVAGAVLLSVRRTKKLRGRTIFPFRDLSTLEQLKHLEPRADQVVGSAEVGPMGIATAAVHFSVDRQTLEIASRLPPLRLQADRSDVQTVRLNHSRMGSLRLEFTSAEGALSTVVFIPKDPDKTERLLRAAGWPLVKH